MVHIDLGERFKEVFEEIRGLPVRELPSVLSPEIFVLSEGTLREIEEKRRYDESTRNVNVGQY